MADRLIVLQEAALDELTPSFREKARVVYQSADPRLANRPPKTPFRIAVIAHLRAEKDPLRAAAALEQLPDRDLEVLQIGEALDARLGAEARQFMARDARYRWLGSVPHRRALERM